MSPASPTGNPSIAVVIVTRDRPEPLRACLGSIAGQSLIPDEVFIVAGSDTSCPDDLLGSFSGLPLARVSCPENNICKSRNAGLHAAQSELVLFIDDDAIARSGWVRAYVEAFGHAPAAWAVGGHAYDSRTSPPSPEFAFGIISPSGQQIEVRDPRRHGIPRGYRPNVKGCNFALRREPVTRLGGFDPFFAFSFDEADLMLTIAAEGGQVTHEPGAAVDHAHAPGHFRCSDPLDRDWCTEYASHTMLMLKHTSGAARLWGWLVISRRLGKLTLRVLFSVFSAGRKPADAISIPSRAVEGIRSARRAYECGGTGLRA